MRKVDERVLLELTIHLNKWGEWANEIDGHLDTNGWSLVRSVMDAVIDLRPGLALERWNDLSSPNRPELSKEAQEWKLDDA